MKVFRKLLSVLLVAGLLVGLMPAISFASEGAVELWYGGGPEGLDTQVTASAIGAENVKMSYWGFVDGSGFCFDLTSNAENFDGWIVNGVEVPYHSDVTDMDDAVYDYIIYGEGYWFVSYKSSTSSVPELLLTFDQELPAELQVKAVFETDGNEEPGNDSAFIVENASGEPLETTLASTANENECDLRVRIPESYSGSYKLKANGGYTFTSLKLDYNTQALDSGVECTLSSDVRGVSKYRLEIESSDGNKSYYNIWCEPAEKAPVLKDPESVSDSVYLYLGQTYSVDLSNIFESLTGAALNYTVSINGTPTNDVLPAAYTYTPGDAGAYTLAFTANDGTYISDAFTVTIHVSYNEISGAGLTDAVASFGQWTPLKTDLFKKKNAALVVPYGETSVDVILTFNSEATGVQINGGEVQTLSADKKYTATLNVSDNGAENTIVPISGGGADATYKIVCYPQKYADCPTSVVDYLCIGSQYTNGLGLADYGLRGVATLIGNSNRETGVDKYSAPASLGNFGGYITYYFKDAIEDDPNNPYGVDFITFGNSVEGSDQFAEPGQVWVSYDDSDYYALAGALHYDNSADWDYSITYTKQSDGKSAWADNLTGSGVQAYEYPKTEYYPLHNFKTGEDSSITLNGILLKQQDGVNEYGNTLPPFPDFGYTDVGLRGTLVGDQLTGSNTAGNPYQGAEVFQYGAGARIRLKTTDGMDLKWAVDSDGYPVTFPDGIHYVKIVTASNIDNGGIGEKSTEVNMVRVAEPSAGNVGVSDTPTAITVGGRTVALQNGVYLYNVPVSGAFEVNVTAAEGANVYINSQRTTNATFAQKPNHGLLRIIVQDGEKTPQIYYLTLTDGGSGAEKYSTITFDAGGGSVEGKSEIEKTYLETTSNTAFPIPIRANYTFLGWYDENDVKIEQYTANLPETLILAAKWEYNGSGGVPGSNGINVTFRLIGAKKSTGDIDLSNGDYKGGDYVTWIPTTPYTLAGESTVYDLFMQALDDAGLSSVGADKNYVKTIYAPSVVDGYALSEFTNGKYSGWMYTVNGGHPAFGLKDYILRDGNTVVWHYVNDYRHEVADWFDEPEYPSLGDGTYFNAWLKARDVRPTANNSLGSTSGTMATAAFLTPAVTASNGTAAVTLGAADMTSVISRAKENNSPSIVIRPEITGEAKKVTVDIPKSSLSSVASETGADLMVETPVGHVTIPNSAVASIASQASGGTVTVSLETVGNAALTPAQREAVGDNPVYDISILSGGKNISSFGGESITISLPYTYKDGETADGVAVWYLDDSGKLTRVACTYDETTGLATFTTTHLSTYVVGYDAWTNPFTDVKSTDWFYDAVKYVNQNSLMSGTTSTIFEPDSNMTRAMLVTVLYRLEGKPAVTGESSFTDIKTGEWYTDAVMWTNTNNIVSGYGNGIFGINDNVTREQLAVILYNYAEYKGYDVTKASEMTGYSDTSSVDSWAAAAMKWAVAEGLISGTTTTTLSPAGAASRAQVAAILMRFAENVVK